MAGFAGVRSGRYLVPSAGSFRAVHHVDVHARSGTPLAVVLPGVDVVAWHGHRPQGVAAMVQDQ